MKTSSTRRPWFRRAPLERLLTFKPWIGDFEEGFSPTDVLGLHGQALLAVADPSPLPGDSDSTRFFY